MARVDTDKTVNATQLGIELGRVPLVVGDGYVSSDAVTEPVLRAALDVHVADVDYIDPLAVPPADPDVDLAARIQAVHEDPLVDANLKKLTAALLGIGTVSAVAGRLKIGA